MLHVGPKVEGYPRCTFTVDQPIPYYITRVAPPKVPIGKVYCQIDDRMLTFKYRGSNNAPETDMTLIVVVGEKGDSTLIFKDENRHPVTLISRLNQLKILMEFAESVTALYLKGELPEPPEN